MRNVNRGSASLGAVPKDFKPSRDCLRTLASYTVGGFSSVAPKGKPMEA